MGFCTPWAIDISGIHKQWLEIVQTELKLPNLGESFKGLKMVQISDLHCSTTVSKRYLRHCVKQVNNLNADLVVLTGDYITHDYSGRFRCKVVEILGGLQARLGVYASLGNHDYGIGGGFLRRKDKELEGMISLLEKTHIKLLRNSASCVEIDRQKLWLVGLGDLWAGDFYPQTAFEKIDSAGAVIALSHNPDTIDHLIDFRCDAVVSGHTHGSGYEWTAMPDRPIVNRRRFHSGMYYFGDKKLYVNRGLGRHGRIIFNKRPEITVFTLC
ncbi:MAG: metallophosphoesterase [Phycisphaerae bacterium]